MNSLLSETERKKVGQEIEVKVLSIDKEKKKISLGYRKAEDNPWNNVKVQVGDIIDGKVVSMKPFGAFVEIADGLEGLVHISNITHKRISKPQDVLEIGQTVTAKVQEVDVDKKRIELSIRELEGVDETNLEETSSTSTQESTTAITETVSSADDSTDTQISLNL